MTIAIRKITDDLIDELHSLQFNKPVTTVYNPLVYARKSHFRYLEKYGRGKREIVLIGMNPGPWGMVQTGVPFGDVSMVRNWIGIEEPVGKPDKEHPKRPIMGFDCPRSEVSGTRLWGWARDRFVTPERFFKRFYVANYCPLCFMEYSGRNLTPDKIPPQERLSLFTVCDRALKRYIKYFQPRYVIGIGRFAEKRARAVLGGFDLTIGGIPHPSPANPAANKGWAEAVTKSLRDCGITL